MKKRNRLRKGIQLFFFLLIALTAVAHTLAESGITIPFIAGASLHAICPFGGVVTLYNLIAAGSFISKIHASSLVLAGIVLISAVLFGPLFCGWVCPFGTFQDWIGKLGKKLFKKRYGKIIPKTLDQVLRYLRYVVLIWVVVMTAKSATLIFADYDPYYALFNFWTGEVAITGYVTLGLVILLSLIVPRPFCRYACPMGALIGMTNWFRIFPVRRKAATCIDCGACDRACPMGISVSTGERVRDHQCISCMECTSEAACPVVKTVDVTGPKSGSTLAISRKVIAPVLLVIMFGGIFLTMAIGWWQTEGGKIPKLITEGEFAGASDPADIRGSYSFADVEAAFGIPAEFLAEAYGYDPSIADSVLAKDVEGLYIEIGTDSIRYLTALWAGLPFTTGEESILTDRGLAMLKEAGKITDAQYAELSGAFVFELPGTTVTDLPEEEHEEETVTAAGVIDIKGKSTVADVIDMGVSLETIEEALGLEVPSKTVILRDFCEENGIEFSDFKAEVLSLVEAQ